MARRRRWWTPGDDTATRPVDRAHTTPQDPVAVPTPPQGAPALPVAIGTRTRPELERLHTGLTEALQRYREKPDYWGSSLPFMEGTAAALSWVLGERDTSPVSELYTPGGPDATALRTEDDAANEACLRPPMDGSNRHYANGVQHTVMWVRGDTDTAPYDL